MKKIALTALVTLAAFAASTAQAQVTIGGQGQLVNPAVRSADPGEPSCDKRMNVWLVNGERVLFNNTPLTVKGAWQMYTLKGIGYGEFSHDAYRVEMPDPSKCHYVFRKLTASGQVVAAPAVTTVAAPAPVAVQQPARPSTVQTTVQVVQQPAAPISTTVSGSLVAPLKYVEKTANFDWREEGAVYQVSFQGPGTLEKWNGKVRTIWFVPTGTTITGTLFTQGGGWFQYKGGDAATSGKLLQLDAGRSFSIPAEQVRLLTTADLGNAGVTNVTRTTQVVQSNVATTVATGTTTQVVSSTQAQCKYQQIWTPTQWGAATVTFPKVASNQILVVDGWTGENAQTITVYPMGYTPEPQVLWGGGGHLYTGCTAEHVWTDVNRSFSGKNIVRK